ncbi:MAG: SdpI family protein [Acidobacteria bacterium]|nr:SdpI family protein [Acidobacteriota bacterium]MBI3425207.1 SdpI family protein [Acidobacteriota bacterium]
MVNLLWMFAGIALIVAGYPLMTRRVPPNHWYGFRVPKTLRDPYVWYEANQVAGRDLILAGVAVLLAALFALLTAWLLPLWLTNSLVYGVFLVMLLLVVVDSFRALRKL